MPAEPPASDDASAAPAHTNRLVHATSPYLLQHAHNPVDWYPWGDEAFAAARAADKPIFLSIGYSTCYWCHVMERESFEDESIAALMNETCICIKVDREERPDVDDLYMMAVQMISGQGGWPMSVFLDPETLHPFFGGTYFPAEEGLGRISFPELLQRVDEFWEKDRDAIRADANRLASRITAAFQGPMDAHPVRRSVLDVARSQLMGSFDAEHGGFVGNSTAPKFPTPVNLDFLVHTAWDRDDCRAAVKLTLDRMALGGTFDQVGGGFHRYSTDRRWVVPHFEKMLYDNGLLASTYAASVERTGDPFHAEVVRRTLDYVLREMRDECGAFHSAQDAEVDAREGLNYLWTPDEMREVLTDAGLAGDLDFTLQRYGLDRGPNFRDPHHPDESPSNVLLLEAPPDDDDERDRWRRINAVLYDARALRPQPSLDDKILTSWNGLMIAGLADGGRVLGEPRFIQAAEQGADAVLALMSDGDGGLLRTRRGSTSRIAAFAEDYAFLVRGLLRLHRATSDERWIDEAMRLTTVLDARFGDPVQGGWFDTLEGQSDLFVRARSTYDGAIPCATSVMIENLVELAAATGDAMWLDRAEAAVRSISPILDRQPTACIGALPGLARLLDARGADVIKPATDAPAGHRSPLGIRVDDVSISEDGRRHSATLVFEMDDAFHITAAGAEDEGLQGLAIDVADDQRFEIAVDWPDPERLEVGDQSWPVYSGGVRIPIEVRALGLDPRPAASVVVLVRVQICDDRQCLPPEVRSIELPSR